MILIKWRMSVRIIWDFVDFSKALRRGFAGDLSKGVSVFDSDDKREDF